MIRTGYFDRIQVNTLNIFDKGPFGHRLVAHIFVNLGLDGREACELGGAGTAFTANQLVTVTDLADDDCLDKTVLLDRFGKLHQFVVAENLARLERVRVDEFDVDFNDLFGVVNSGCIFGAVLGVIFSGL